MKNNLATRMYEEGSSNWLHTLTSESISHEKFPLHSILKDSLFYPASYLDGDPVKFLGNSFCSFIYVDYQVSHERLMSELETIGFRGYHLLGMRSVLEHELTPNGWQPEFFGESGEEDPNKFHSIRVKTFCDWCVFERDSELSESHGPPRFSFLFICGEGVATFQALYYGNKCFPKGVAIIQPGTGFGFNWTDFRNPARIFARSVMQNRFGVPEVLINGGMGANVKDYYSPIWPEYTERIAEFSNGIDHSFVVWKNNSLGIGPTQPSEIM